MIAKEHVGKPRVLSLPRGRFLPLGGVRHVMGIVNVTPDSFWKASRAPDTDGAVRTALAMVRFGATIIDIGGESSRPGASYVDAGEEASRVAPVVLAIRRAAEVEHLDPVISIDTRKAAVARAALDAGADIINDISALKDDRALAGLCAERGVPVILMHMKGIPVTMQDAPWYADCAAEVLEFLVAAAESAQAAGIPADRILLDPGIGFGKRLSDNIDLLKRLEDFSSCGYPVVVGLSRKSFIGALTGRAVEDRLPGSLAAACAAFLGGADIFRVHDVPETVDALKVFGALQGFEATKG
jgi:dihydropteroate synthase